VNRPSAPRIVITVSDPARSANPTLAREKQQRYADAVARHGAEPVFVHAGLPAAERAPALATMDGLLLSGGRDIDPARYGRPRHPRESVEADRDAMESEAWAAAGDRALPVVGVCRGLQAINVFSGGSLIQDLDGHAEPAGGSGRVTMHPLRVEPGTRLARILFPTNVRGGVLEVNSSHHQGVGPADLAPGLIPNARAASKAGELIEGLETRDGRFVLGVQCHPERTESTPKQFERLFGFFVDAARGPATRR
jgi:gamma-glutamyl-gamma-aminobutyrate hydrolase PuuD